MANRIVVDPITRIEGHLRAEVEITDGTIREAFLSSTMVRGLENIVKGRNPKDVWAFVHILFGCVISRPRFEILLTSQTQFLIFEKLQFHFLLFFQVVAPNQIQFFLQALKFLDMFFICATRVRYKLHCLYFMMTPHRTYFLLKIVM